MANSNGDFNPVFNNPLPPEFVHWPLDTYLDDDEFRAGYPFSDVPEMDNNDGESYNFSSTPDDDAFQSNNSGNVGCISTTKDDQPGDLLSEPPEEEKSVLGESHLMVERDGNHEIRTIQHNSYNEGKKRDDHHQHDTEEPVPDISSMNLERSSHVERSDDYVDVN